MATHKVSFYSRLPSLDPRNKDPRKKDLRKKDSPKSGMPELVVGEPAANKLSTGIPGASVDQRVEPATCTEAESFVLQVLDDSMQPEFRKGCIIVIDPTGLARDRSYVLARSTAVQDAELGETDGFVFRQLQKGQNDEWLLVALNTDFPIEVTPADLNRIVGVIVQRAGTRRRYHKHYD